jgi:hypothetical protein
MKFLAFIVGGLTLAAVAASAQDHHDHMQIMSKMAKDDRTEVKLPAPMKANMLSNMRGHQAAIGAILAALGKGDGAEAATIAETRLG